MVQRADEVVVASNRDGVGSSSLITLSKGRASVAHARAFWYVLALGKELKSKPIGRSLFGTPLVLFRDERGQASCLLDRCPHRNVPLSLGERTAEGLLQCAYHGWRFDGEGACRFVPSLVGGEAANEDEKPIWKGRRAIAFPTIEQDGFVWVYGVPGEMPESRPHAFAMMHERGYTTVRQVVEAKATLYSTIENALDVPHTAYLHRGLFRSESRGLTITAQVQRTHDRVEAEYVGEPRPPGIIAKILSPSGGLVTHFDRFILPSIAQVEYRIGTENHLLVDSVMTPVDDFITRIYAVVSFKMRLPGWLVRPFVKPLALRVFKQDAFILERQTKTIHTFGGEQFVSTEIDVLGKHIWRLLKSAERGEVVDDEASSIDLVV